jgi:hypothetical protein
VTGNYLTEKSNRFFGCSCEDAAASGAIIRKVSNFRLPSFCEDVNDCGGVQARKQEICPVGWWLCTRIHPYGPGKGSSRRAACRLPRENSPFSIGGSAQA